MRKYRDEINIGADLVSIWRDGGQGDTIYAIGNGYVNEILNNYEDWNSVVRIVHSLPNGKIIESLYANFNEVLVSNHTWIKKGTPIGLLEKINTNGSAYLHFEVRDSIDMPSGYGSSIDSVGYLDPLKFIKVN